MTFGAVEYGLIPNFLALNFACPAPGDAVNPWNWRFCLATFKISYAVYSKYSSGCSIALSSVYNAAPQLHRLTGYQRLPLANYTSISRGNPDRLKTKNKLISHHLLYVVILTAQPTANRAHRHHCQQRSLPARFRLLGVLLIGRILAAGASRAMEQIKKGSWRRAAWISRTEIILKRLSANVRPVVTANDLPFRICGISSRRFQAQFDYSVLYLFNVVIN
jgi:hypothetical protein